MTLLPFRGRCWTCGTDHPQKHVPLEELFPGVNFEGKVSEGKIDTEPLSPVETDSVTFSDCTFSPPLPYDFLLEFYEKWKDKTLLLERLEKQIEYSEVAVKS